MLGVDRLAWYCCVHFRLKIILRKFFQMSRRIATFRPKVGGHNLKTTLVIMDQTSVSTQLQSTLRDYTSYVRFPHSEQT